MADDESVHIKEAARLLGTSEPRLRRYLARRDFAGASWKQEHQTETGIRTATFVAVPVIDRLRDALGSEPKRERARQPEQKQNEPEQAARLVTFSGSAEGSPTAPPGPGAAPGGEAVAAVVDAIVDELRARLEAQQQEIDYLRGALQREQELRLNEQRLLAQEQQMRALAAAPVEPEGAAKKNGVRGDGGSSLVVARLRMEVAPNAG